MTSVWQKKGQMLTDLDFTDVTMSWNAFKFKFHILTLSAQVSCMETVSVRSMEWKQNDAGFCQLQLTWPAIFQGHCRREMAHITSDSTITKLTHICITQWHRRQYIWQDTAVFQQTLAVANTTQEAWDWFHSQDRAPLTQQLSNDSQWIPLMKMDQPPTVWIKDAERSWSISDPADKSLGWLQASPACIHIKTTKRVDLALTVCPPRMSRHTPTAYPSQEFPGLWPATTAVSAINILILPMLIGQWLAVALINPIPRCLMPQQDKTYPNNTLQRHFVKSMFKAKIYAIFFIYKNHLWTQVKNHWIDCVQKLPLDTNIGDKQNNIQLKMSYVNINYFIKQYKNNYIKSCPNGYIHLTNQQVNFRSFLNLIVLFMLFQNHFYNFVLTTTS